MRAGIIFDNHAPGNPRRLTRPSVGCGPREPPLHDGAEDVQMTPSCQGWGHWLEPSTAHLVEALVIRGFCLSRSGFSAYPLFMGLIGLLALAPATEAEPRRARRGRGGAIRREKQREEAINEYFEEGLSRRRRSRASFGSRKRRLAHTS